MVRHTYRYSLAYLAPVSPLATLNETSLYSEGKSKVAAVDVVIRQYFFALRRLSAEVARRLNTQRIGRVTTESELFRTGN